MRIIGIGLVIIGMFVLKHSLVPVNDAKKQIAPKYDYIVVGGGPSGVMVATNLARQHPQAKVLLLESGTASQSSVLVTVEKQRWMTDINWGDPALHLNRFDIPLMWSASAVSMQNDSPRHWPVGNAILARALGGCGLVNAMIYIRSLPTDFHRWNLTGWSWDIMLQHFKTLENFVDHRWAVPRFWSEQNQTTPSWRGREGPVATLSSGPSVDAVAPLFVESFLASGSPLAERGFNNPNPSRRVGAGYYEFNINNGVRHSIVEAFLGGWNSDTSTPPANLFVKTDSTVRRVLFDGQNMATGVEYFHLGSGVEESAFLQDSNSEVILAAGAIMTPQLLFNSGIFEGGSVADIPGVGKNLQDHPVVSVVFELSPGLAQEASTIYTVANDMDSYFNSVQELKDIQEQGLNMTIEEMQETFANIGVLGTSGFSAGAFLRSPWARDDAPDLQLTVFPRVIEPHLVKKIQKTRKDFPFSAPAMLITVALLDADARHQIYPGVGQSDEKSSSKSKTQKKLSERGFEMPTIGLPPGQSQYLSDKDVEKLSWGVEEVRRVLSFAPLSLKTGTELIPGTSVVGDALHQHVRANQMANSHWVGSTKMGSSDDPMAVVDERLRVRGVDRLRIVDAGVIPHVPNGNTHSTVSAIASRAADLITEDRLKTSE